MINVIKEKNSVAVRSILVVFFIFGLVSCSSLRVKTDYNPDYDFSRLATYNWVPNPKSGVENSLFEKHFHKIMGEKLAEKGITLSETTPDFLIAYYGNVKSKINVQNWGYRYPGWYGGVEVYQYDEGTMVVDFVDAKTKELIYRGTVTAEVNRGNMDMKKRQKRITEAVEKILKDFPPKSK